MSLPTKHIRSVIAATFIAGTVFGLAGSVLAASLGSAIFPDVASGSFYDSAIGQMYSLGIIKGYDNGKFGPDDAVTRGQLAVMLQRFRADLLKNGGVASSSSSSRVSSSSSSSSSSTVATPQGSVRFTSATYSTAESSTLQVLVVRTGGAQGSITVDYATSDGSAIAGTDYTAKNGTLSFANNETSKSFTVTMTNNPLPQGNKTFNVKLSNVTNNGTLSTPNTAVVTILDNQTSSSSSSVSSGASSSSSSSNPAGTFNLGATTYMQNEIGGPITITVNREGGSTGAATIAYGTSNGTATSGNEYTSVSGTLTYNAGETAKTFQIPVNNNSNVTGNKVFNIIIGSPTGGASLGTVSTATVTVFDNESGAWGSGSVKFTKSTYNVSKSAGYVDIAIQRVGSAGGTVTVNYNTTPISAAAGVDYGATTGTLSFLPGEATKLVRVPIYKTSSANSGKVFNLDLSSVSSNATLGSPTTTAVTIDN